MAHVTLSVPDELYAKMKRHPEIKWSEAAREGIRQQLKYIEKVISGKELLARLSPETRIALEEIPHSKWVEGYKKMKESERKRLKFLIQALSSKKK